MFLVPTISTLFAKFDQKYNLGTYASALANELNFS